eukprot:484287-Rhodomonas_salina.1
MARSGASVVRSSGGCAAGVRRVCGGCAEGVRRIVGFVSAARAAGRATHSILSEGASWLQSAIKRWNWNTNGGTGTQT